MAAGASFFWLRKLPRCVSDQYVSPGQVDRQLQASDPELAEQFQGILVSVDPERDSIENLARYATAFSPRFLGVTGQEKTWSG